MLYNQRITIFTRILSICNTINSCFLILYLLHQRTCAYVSVSVLMRGDLVGLSWRSSWSFCVNLRFCSWENLDIFCIWCKPKVCKFQKKKTAWMWIVCTIVIHTMFWKFTNARLTSPSGPIRYSIWSLFLQQKPLTVILGLYDPFLYDPGVTSTNWSKLRLRQHRGAAYSAHAHMQFWACSKI